jgi:beta-1,4-mannosyltransferase
VRILARPGDNAQNPYVRLLYGSLQSDDAVTLEGFRPWSALRCRRPDVFLVQWPETVFDHSLVAGLLVGWGVLLSAAILRWRGCRVVWIAHNLQSHERRFPVAEDRFWLRFCRVVDATVALSHAGLAAAVERHPALAGKPGIVAPHGHYRGVYPDTLDREEARRRLGIPSRSRVALFLGRILSYKNVPALVAAFREGAAENDILLVVGRPREAHLAREIIDAAGGDPRIRTHFGFVPEEDLQTWFRAADLCVLPFREILNSGSAILSLSFDLPVMVPARGAMAELRDQTGPDWVKTYEGPLTADVLRQALAWSDRPHPRQTADLRKLDWSAIGAEFVNTLKRLAGPRAVKPGSNPSRPPRSGARTPSN